eukprot:gene7053-12684_t
MQNTSLNETVRCSTGIPFPRPNSGKFYASTITEIVFLISTSAFSSILNAVIVVSLVRKEQLRTPANLILTSMAVSDFLVGFLSEPIAVTRRIFDIYVIYRTIRSLTKRTATVAIAESIPRNRDLKLVDNGVSRHLNQGATSRIERLEISVVNNEEGGSPAAITTNIRNLKGEKSRSWTAFILLSVFYLSYLPYFILGRVFERVQVDETSKYIARFWTINIIFLNSSLNPIIYCVRVQDIRLQLKATVAACFSLVRPAGELY